MGVSSFTETVWASATGLVFTVTVNTPLALLPAASVAVQVTLVVPGAKVLPETGVQLGVRSDQSG
jgi:hypothetical protein